MSNVKKTILEKAGFNFDELEPKENYANKCFIPVFFCHGKNDQFVDMHHTKDLYKEYAGPKKALFVEGDHNSIRPKIFRKSVSVFFYEHLQVAKTQKINQFLNAKSKTLDKDFNFKRVINNNNILRVFNKSNAQNNMQNTGAKGIVLNEFINKTNDCRCSIDNFGFKDKIMEQNNRLLKNKINLNYCRNSITGNVLNDAFVYKLVKEYPEAKTYQVRNGVNNNDSSKFNTLDIKKVNKESRDGGNILNSDVKNTTNPTSLQSDSNKTQKINKNSQTIHYEDGLNSKTNRKKIIEKDTFNINSQSMNCLPQKKNDYQASYRLSYRMPSMVGEVNNGKIKLKKI